MQVGVVRMGVDQRRMDVRMRVGLASVPREIVGMPVVLVVAMGMRMLLALMGVLVQMPFGHVQPYPHPHQRSRQQQRRRR